MKSLINEQDLMIAFRDGKKSLVDFRRIFHPARNESLPANFHFEWSRILLEEKDNFAIEAFRESAKSTYIDKEFPLSDAAGAHAYIESRKAVGRVVLIP